MSRMLVSAANCGASSDIVAKASLSSCQWNVSVSRIATDAFRERGKQYAQHAYCVYTIVY
eukprot:scaffold270407_cov15-Prasinocladus_malaysianus.AAC.1